MPRGSPADLPITPIATCDFSNGSRTGRTLSPSIFRNGPHGRPRGSSGEFAPWARRFSTPITMSSRTNIRNSIPANPSWTDGAAGLAWKPTAIVRSRAILLADKLSRFLGENHPPIRVVPHGVWTVPETGKPPSLDERLGWKRLLSFGAIRKNKGIDLLLRAAEQLPGYSITIAGEPLHLDYFRTEILPLVRRLQAKGVKVDLLDRFIPDEQVGALFASHSAIVLPYTSQFVAQSGVAFMALAYDLPVVASEAGGLRDLFDQFKIGATFRDATPEALAAAVQAALFARLTARSGQKQIAAATERYSWQQAARATLAGYALDEEKASNAENCPIAATATI